MTARSSLNTIVSSPWAGAATRKAGNDSPADAEQPRETTGTIPVGISLLGTPTETHHGHVASISSDRKTVAGTGVRNLRVALGLIWILDAALQFQPYMFTRGFVNDVLLASAQGNPGFVFHPTITIANFIAPHIAAWNVLFALLQLFLGVGIIAGTLARRSSLLGGVLAASILWSALVWWLSEGLGGTLSGASPLAGAPGPVLLYAVVAVLLWPGQRTHETPIPAPHLGSRAARMTWLASWALCGFLLLEPPNQARGAVSSVVSEAASGEPGFLHGMLSSVAGSLRGAGPWVDSFLALAMVAIGVAVAFGFRPRAFLGASIAVAAAIWVFGEGFGGILTGQGTDPNSGPLWMLFALCMWVGLREARAEPELRGTAQAYATSPPSSMPRPTVPVA